MEGPYSRGRDAERVPLPRLIEWERSRDRRERARVLAGASGGENRSANPRRNSTPPGPALLMNGREKPSALSMS